ncbi:MAG: hypothetical protein ACP5MD_14465 [Verrucomicrobiia bacterium]
MGVPWALAGEISGLEQEAVLCRQDSCRMGLAAFLDAVAFPNALAGAPAFLPEHLRLRTIT